MSNDQNLPGPDAEDSAAPKTGELTDEQLDQVSGAGYPVETMDPLRKKYFGDALDKPPAK